MIVVKQRPQTATGITFIGLSDEHGMLDVVVRPDVYAGCRSVIRDASILFVEGVVQKQGEAVSVLAYEFVKGR